MQAREIYLSIDESKEDEGLTLQNVLSSLDAAKRRGAINKVYCRVAFQQGFTWDGPKHNVTLLADIWLLYDLAYI